MQDTSDVTRRLWALCGVLRNEGVTYHEYLNELTYLLFLKLAHELEMEHRIPDNCRWIELSESASESILSRYTEMLKNLGAADDEIVKTIFADSKTGISSGESLMQLVQGIEDIDWYRARQNGLGDVYEGLIQKNAQESRYGAGQYFTPRPVVEALVQVTAPSNDDVVYDPAAGTGGFLVAAGLGATTGNTSPPKLVGVELVRDVQRMALMNLLLHGLEGKVILGDALHRDVGENGYSVCLTNPPFGAKGALTAEQNERLEYQTSNKQLAFLQHVYQNLAEGGRAAIVVPDNVLFEGGTAAAVRTKLLEGYRVHTILSLPTGIFYATGVKTSVLFFCADGATEETWFYDLRSGQTSFGKRRQLLASDLNEFIAAYGADALGKSPRVETGRFKRLTREELAARGDRLDFAHVKSTDRPTGTNSITDLLEETRSLREELDSALSGISEIEKILTRHFQDREGGALER
ncbi:type I restriction enzyme M protein [Streptomyces sp. SAI-133]|uniref:class I SAM-dependent DNA methyltransferase n=1 Tax=unclassified Streptomyces TaxID=2593676 RepID=UPI0024756944|nr:N-6 DNA methylase [Streptomyces sp. SAI-133]MDH6585742.1 type I restriction enzyme M protein [Streptomyces sp. SAI-133]